MNELITRSVEEGNVKWLGEMPDDLMNEHEESIVKFVLDYAQKYGSPPSPKRLMKEFDAFVAFKFTPTSWEPEPPPIGDVFEQTVKRKLFEATEHLMREAETLMSREGDVPLDVFAEIERLHTMSLGVHRYSKFDRSLYFRRGVMDLPFKIINSHIGGVSNGDYMLIAGRLGTGKSTIAQFFAKHAWLRKKNVLFVSAEMLAADVFSRLDAMMGKFNPLYLRRGRSPEIESMLDDVRRRVEKREGEIIIPKNRLLTPSQVASFAKNLNVDLIIVDGAYLMRPSSGGFTSKWEKVMTVSNELKQMALDLDLPIIGTTQIKRGTSGADGYDPEDLSYSDALGQDADFILAAWPNPTLEGRIELQLIKNRYGEQCATQIHIDFDTMTIRDESIEGASDDSGKMSADEWVRRYDG